MTTPNKEIASRRLTEAQSYYDIPESVPEESLALSASMPFPRGLDRHSVFTPFDHGPYNWRTSLMRIEQDWFVGAIYTIFDFFDAELAAWGMKAARIYHPRDQDGQPIPGLKHLEVILEATTPPPMVSQGPPGFRRYFLDLTRTFDQRLINPLYLRTEYGSHRKTPSRVRLPDMPVGKFLPLKDPDTIKKPIAPFAEWRIDASAVPYRKYINGQWVTVLEEPTMARVIVSVAEIVSRIREQLQRERLEREREEVAAKEFVRQKFIEANQVRAQFLTGKSRRAFDQEQGRRTEVTDRLEAELALYEDAKEMAKADYYPHAHNQLYLPERGGSPQRVLEYSRMILALTGTLD